MLPLVHLKQYVEVTIRELGNNNVNVNESEIVVPSMIKSKSNMSYVIYVSFGSPETLSWRKDSWNEAKTLTMSNYVNESEIVVPLKNVFVSKSMVKKKLIISYMVIITFGWLETVSWGNDFRELEQQQSEIIVPSITSLIHML
jgi:hypothetical protein